MIDQEVIDLLKAERSDERLRAARLLARKKDSSNVEIIRDALRAEKNKWVRSALSKALDASEGKETPFLPDTEPELDPEDAQILLQLKSDAVLEVTKRLVHEIRPIMGRLDVWARQEFSGYPSSSTKREWDRLERLMKAIDMLGKAAAPPSLREFDLAQLIADIVNSEVADHRNMKVDLHGPSPCWVRGSSELLDLIISNGVRNAIESVLEIEEHRSIVVTWGETERDNWVSVLDRGKGLPLGIQNIFELGSTTKKGHLGVGLAQAKQASITLRGELRLSPSKGGGAQYEFRWPKLFTN